ncbi:MAG TPA: serine/threonine-protein kinase [Thermoleophilaceae bacterium]|nr:serine/threonine-protein kinase [Thermoleophilaceae bacterium]
MKRPEISLTEEPGTLPLGGSDPTEALPGAPGPRLILGRYRLERRLGAGGFGVVWLAWDEKLEREVAVKAIPLENGGGERVEREARAAARLNHPGIVGIYELAHDEHDVYLVSELVRGRTLAELLRAGAVADRDVARIGMALCEALDHAHARGVIHRDVKPQNVMVVADPAAGAGFAKLADFGVAHVASGDPLTRTGDVVGTLAYMAPEQAEGARTTPASDVYSLALTLYEAWTGANPVRAGGPAATARRLGRPLPSLAAARRDLPLELCDALDAALDIDPARRPPPAELRAELSAAEAGLDEEGGLAEPATQRRVGLPTTERRRTALTRLLFGRPTALDSPVVKGSDPLSGSDLDRERQRHDQPAGRLRSFFGAGAQQPTHGLLGRPSPFADGRPTVAARLLGRAGAGLLAGAVALGAIETLGPEPTFSPVAAAAAAALAVGLLPRIGWLLAAAGLCAWLVSPDADRQGTALVIAAAAAPIPFLLPRAGLLWSLPVLAPLLGTVALGPVFVGVAALAPTVLRRAGLAAAGFLWLAIGELLAGESLLFGVPDGALSRGDWEGSISAAASDALGPLVSSPALAPAAVWAAFAVLLPLLVRGRWLTVDIAGAVLWVVGVIAAHIALGDMLAATTVLDEARGAAAGAVGAALVVLAVSQLAAPADGWRAQPAATA